MLHACGRLTQPASSGITLEPDMPEPTKPSDVRPVPSPDATPRWRTIALAAVLGSVASLAVAVVARLSGVELSIPDQVDAAGTPR